MSKDEALSSLAMLKVNYDENPGRNYLDYLVPFLVLSIQEERLSVVGAKDARDALRRNFGLDIPLQVTELVLRRLAKKGNLTRGAGMFSVRKLPETHGVQPQRARAKRDIGVILQRLRAYVGDEFSVSWSLEDAADALMLCLSSFSVDFLRSYIKGAVLPADRPDQRKNALRVLAFVRHVHRTSTELFDAFLVLVKGRMLANALLCSDLESLGRSFSQVTFYLDTPLALRLLEAGDSPEHLAAVELVQLLKQLDGRLAVFSHTMDEVDNVLAFVERTIDDLCIHRSTMDRLRLAHVTRSDIALMRQNLGRELGRHGVGVLRTPKHIVPYEIGERELDGILEEEIFYNNPRAPQYDIDSIRSVYTLRKDTAPRRLEDAQAILVTTNAGLARVADRYSKEHESSTEVSTVITDFVLANVAWLKAPMGAVELPRLELMSLAYAALDPPAKLWAKYLEEIDKLREQGDITEADHEALRSKLVVGEALVIVELDDDTSTVTRETIEEVRRRVKKEMSKEKQAELEAEREAHAATRKVLEEASSQNAAFQDKLFWLSQKIGKAMSIVTFLVGLAAVVLVSAGSGWKMEDALDCGTWWAIGLLVLLCVSVILYLLSMVYGMSIRDLSLWIQRKVTRAVLLLLYRFWGIEAVSDQENDALRGLVGTDNRQDGKGLE